MEEVAAPAAMDSLGESCSLDNYLSQPDHTMDARIAAARATLGTDVVLLGHHYQRDEVIRFADYTGDSYKLSKIAFRMSSSLATPESSSAAHGLLPQDLRVRSRG